MMRDGLESMSRIMDVSLSRLYASIQNFRDGRVVDVDPERYDEIEIAAGAACSLVSRNVDWLFLMSDSVS